ncbi:IS630 family transposase [Kineococcus sp. NBC_00420]|uniref:IS630 family transposase n=1 Tax=Kineococcus sp. NBC_00420 TaxID=2903564 RepID=UPI002E1AE842
MGMLLPTMPRLDDATRAALTKIATGPTSQQRHADRARWVLALHDSGGEVRTVADTFTVSPTTVRKWTRRVAAAGVDGLQDAERSGRPLLYDDTAVRDLITLATSQPPSPAALWTHAALAAEMGERNWGVTASWVTRTLTRLQLKVHQVRGWIHRRTDPDFDTKVAAVQHVVANAALDPYPVLSLDEKTAFSVRTPVCADTRDRQGRTRREFEYVRRGTISWYGVQDVATGAVSMRRATARMDSAAFTDLLKNLQAEHGPVFTLVMDNGSAHTSKHTRQWLTEHPGVTVVHTPVHASWVNPIESVFGICVRQVLRHGVFEGTDDCDAMVQAWAERRNRSLRPVTFTWQSTPA